MYYSNLADEFNQGNFELLPHERISEIWAEDFQRYLDRWINFWPKNTQSGYYRKFVYDGGFYQAKSKKNPEKNAHLYGDYLVEQVERHLDPQHWKYRKESKQYTPVKHTQFWLGLNMPKKTTVSCIDPDAKQYLLGFYQIGNNDPLRPVLHLPLEHFKRLKLIYDHFPGRVWCISSATLGMHVWLKYAKPVNSEKVHKNTKAELERLGLGKLEVHPMPGRCLRRPFGKDYATITKEGVLTTWQSQSTFFEFVSETPPFELIARTLLAKVREQWRLWRSCGDAKKNADPRKVIAEHQHEVDEVERWIDQGCSARTDHRILAQNDNLPRWIDAGCPSRQQQRTITVDPENAAALVRWIDAGGQDNTIQFPAISPHTLISTQEPASITKKVIYADSGREPASITEKLICSNSGHEPASITEKVIYSKSGDEPASITEKLIYANSETPEPTTAHGSFDLESLRNGRWATGLREIAINGLPCSKSLHAVCYELAKWLYWVELYKRPDSEKVIYRLLSSFVAHKHNGHCSRIIDGNIASVEQDLKNAIKSAKKLHPAYRMESLELFAKVRQKRSQGQYKHVINLAPLLEGDNVTSSSSSGLLICVSSLETALPKEVQGQITKKAGRNKVMTFATRLINLLHQHRGSCRLHQDKVMELVGYKNKNQATKYMNILIAAKVVKKGKFYQKCKSARLYTLSKDVMSLLNDARIKEELVA